jgi:hypothetical protein
LCDSLGLVALLQEDPALLGLELLQKDLVVLALELEVK